MNDDNNSVFGEVLESAGTVAKQTGKVATNAVSDFATGAASQLGVPVADNSSVPAGDVNTEDVVKGLYEKSQPQNSQTKPAQSLPTSGKNPSDLGKTPEELANLEVIRKELHAAYYQSLTNPPKPEEESVTEKIEREKQEEMVDLQQKKMEKPPELTIQRQAQRVEKFPGASG